MTPLHVCGIWIISSCILRNNLISNWNICRNYVQSFSFNSIPQTVNSAIKTSLWETHCFCHFQTEYVKSLFSCMQNISIFSFSFQAFKMSLFICLLYSVIMALSSVIRLAKMFCYLVFHFLGRVMFTFLFSVMVTEILTSCYIEVCILNTGSAGYRLMYIPCGIDSTSFLGANVCSQSLVWGHRYISFWIS